MKFNLSLIALSLACFAIKAEDKLTITGAGATFPAAVYERWAENYAEKNPLQVNYQAIGSGGGIKQITAGTVDFGATDKPLKKKELDEKGLIQFPTLLGGIVPIINLPGIKPGSLKLTGELLADIFMGKITSWNDPLISKINPSLKLPNKKINVVYRSDRSGTTFIFTNYLSKVSKSWSEQIGNDSTVKWPVGIGGKGSTGVATFVRQVEGSIGYIESSYAIINKLDYASLSNKAGKFLKATPATVQAAAQNANWSDPYVILTDQDGKDAWPITGVTFILMHKNIEPANVKKAKATLDFFDWAFTSGQKDAAALEFVTLPKSVIKKIRAEWKSDIKDKNNQPVWKK